MFKSNEELQSLEDESTESEEDCMAMIARGLKKMFKSRTFDPKKFYEKGSSSKKDEKSSKGNKTSNKNETNFGPCFGCGLPACGKGLSDLTKQSQKENAKG